MAGHWPRDCAGYKMEPTLCSDLPTPLHPLLCFIPQDPFTNMNAAMSDLSTSKNSENKEHIFDSENIVESGQVSVENGLPLVEEEVENSPIEAVRLGMYLSSLTYTPTLYLSPTYVDVSSYLRSSLTM
jgi:hypothetical protein